jgi:uncharacterized protein YukJ
MPIANYGVLKGKAIATDRDKPGDKTPHFEIHVTAAQKHYRVAVNVQSQEPPSDVLYCVNENFTAPRLQQLKSLSAGFAALTNRRDLAIDYVRSGLFDHTTMKPLPANAPGGNDLDDLVQKYVGLAVSSPGAMLYAFGSRFGPEKGKDPTFGFSPQLGVHDIHMNQGNSPNFAGDDGVYQDGALLINLPQKDQWIAIFLAFQSQSFQTDDRTGHRLATAAAVGGAAPPEPAASNSDPKRKRRK